MLDVIKERVLIELTATIFPTTLPLVINELNEFVFTRNALRVLAYKLLAVAENEETVVVLKFGVVNVLVFKVLICPVMVLIKTE